MSDDGRSYLGPSAGSSRRIDETPSTTNTATTTSSSSSINLSPADDAVDVSSARHLYYPCTGNVDIKTYIDARMYGLSFRRLHDEWVVLGRPRIDTSHWPRMIGHRGLPNSPEDFVRVAEYYDRKIYGQVLLMEQGKPANADRPLDDFVVSMVTTAAVVNADIAVFRLARSQPSVEDAVTHRTWYQTFTTFLQDSIRHFINERRVCDRLPPHQCVTPLLFGQACSMSLPDLLKAMTYQVEIFQNLFPNFGEHISRCAAASTHQQWPSSSVSRMPHAASRPNQLTAYDSATRGDPMQQQQQQLQQNEMDPNRPLSVVVVPSEVEHRNDLFIASIDPTIRCDVPVERVAGIIDSRVRVSGPSTSASSASTPASIKMSAPLANTPAGSSFSSMTSQPSSDADSQKRKNSEVLNEDERLVLRPPLQSLTSWGGETVGRSASEEYGMITPDEVDAALPSRSLSNPSVSYFSSLPTTPTEGVPSMTHLSAQDAAHPYLDRRPHRSNTGLSVTSTSTSDPDSRKRSRAEQNREKMKAYHKRVMQQREALAGMLADLTAHVGSVPLPSSRQAGAPSIAGSHTSDETTTKSTPRNTSEPSWSITLRNKQKQESKARLRKREIDQVHELRLYASYAVTILLRSSESSMMGGSAYQKSSGMSGAYDEHWRGQPVSEADKHTTHAIVRVLARNRSNWTALVSAEQRLMGEVAKLTLSEDEERMLRGAGSNEVIKALIDRIQMEERAGTFVLPPTDSTSVFGGSASYDSRGGAGSSSASPFLSSGGMASRAPTLQQLARHSGFSPSLMHPGSLVISPGSSDYGLAVSPSGVTRPAGTDDTGDYFGQDRRRYPSRYSDSSGTAPSVFSSTISPSYNTTESANVHFANRSPSGGSMMSPPSVLASNSYSYNAMYAGGGGSSAQQQHHRMGMQPGMERQMQAGGSGMSQGQQTPAMEHAQLRMSTPYDARGYGQATMDGAVGSRMELHAPQSLQAPSFGYANSMASPSGAPSGGQQVYGMHSPDSTSTLQAYRSNQAGQGQYTQSPHQQNPYDQQGGYGGQQ